MKYLWISLILKIGNVILWSQNNIDFAVWTSAKAIVNQVNQNPNMYVWGNYTKPQGGYLFRFYFDVTADGRDELFVGSSINVDRWDSQWMIFEHKNNNQYRLIGNNLVLGAAGFQIGSNPNSPTIVIVRGRPVDEVSIIKYIYLTNKFVEQPPIKLPREDGFAYYEDDEKINNEINKKYELGRFVKFDEFKVEKILLAEYLKNPSTATWRPWYYRNESGFSPGYYLDQQYLDPADTNAIKQVKNFTPQEAQRLLEQWGKKENKNENQTINEPTTPTTSIPQNNQNNQITKITAFNNWPLIGWIGLGAVLVGLVTYLLLKK